MPDPTTWTKEEILRAIKAGGKPIVTSNVSGSDIRDLGLVAAMKILDDGKRYRVSVESFEVIVFLPALPG